MGHPQSCQVREKDKQQCKRSCLITHLEVFILEEFRVIEYSAETGYEITFAVNKLRFDLLGDVSEVWKQHHVRDVELIIACIVQSLDVVGDTAIFSNVMKNACRMVFLVDRVAAVLTLQVSMLR